MIWATVDDLRTRLGADTGLDDPALQRAIDSARRSLTLPVVRWPRVDPDTDRAEDPDVRTALIDAIEAVIRARIEQAKVDGQLGGLSAVLAAGGSVSAGKLSVSGGKGAQVGSAAPRLPPDAWEALCDTGMVGGAVASW